MKIWYHNGTIFSIFEEEICNYVQMVPKWSLYYCAFLFYNGTEVVS